MTPDFVQYGSLMTPPAPFKALNTTLDGFWVKADGEKLDALCQTVFAGPSGGEVDYRAIGDWVMLTWGQTERVISETPPYDQRGAVAEPQIAIWIPVARVKPKGDRLVAESFAVFVSYIWLDNAMSLATGRELFGYPKAWGWLGFPEQGGAQRWTLDVFGLNYREGELAERHPLLEMVEGDTVPGGPESEIEGLADIARHMFSELFDTTDEVHGLRFAVDIARDIRNHQFNGVFLRQFRSVEDGNAAALQQIVEVTYEVLAARAKPRFREYTLTVHPLDSHPVVEELGIVSPQTVHVAYRMEGLDFQVGRGRVLWDAAGTS